MLQRCEGVTHNTGRDLDELDKEDGQHQASQLFAHLAVAQKGGRIVGQRVQGSRTFLSRSLPHGSHITVQKGR